MVVMEMQQDQDVEYIDTKEAARRLGVSRTTLQRFIDDKLIETEPFSPLLERPRRYRVLASSVEWLKANPPKRDEAAS